MPKPLRMAAATVICQGPGLVLPHVGTGGHNSLRLIQVFNRNNTATPCQAYNRIHKMSVDSATDIVAYCHDDLTVHDDDWRGRVLTPFNIDPNCIAVGLGGATALGHQNLYRRPYDINKLARAGYCSNQTDWQTHGVHLQGTKRVAVLDAFFMAVRADFLTQIGGWPEDHLTHHCLDLWLACEAARHGKTIYAVGVSCTHHGGGTSTKPEYEKAGWLQGGALDSDHQEPHRWLFENYRDVLPFEVW